MSEVARQPYTGGGGSSLNAQAQWFEVHNTSAADIDLSGWYIEEQDGDSFSVSPAAGLVVAAGGPAGGFGAVIPPWLGNKSYAVTLPIGACIDCEPPKT